MGKINYYDYDEANFGNKYYDIHRPQLQPVSYGTSEQYETVLSYQNQYPEQEREQSCITPFLKTFLIINGFVLVTFALFLLIDYLANKHHYIGLSKELFYRDVMALLIILLCWYVLIIPTLLIVVYCKSRNRKCYDTYCDDVNVFICCDVLVNICCCICDACRLAILLDILGVIIKSDNL